MHDRKQLFGRAFLAAANRVQDLRDLTGFRHNSALYTGASRNQDKELAHGGHSNAPPLRGRNLAHLDTYRRITGGMERNFQTLALDGLDTGNQPLSWPTGVMEKFIAPESEIRNAFVRNLAGIEPSHGDSPESEYTQQQQEPAETGAFGDLIGQSAAMRNIASLVELVAPTDASVLILGETGTGKELVAREIHKRSRRSGHPLIRVNCASIPRELYESEFFGHAKGSFTGALRDRAGRFEAAHGGTLLLDEVGEIPLELQGKFLRVLQEKQYERVGEERTRSVDVRIITATNRKLKKDVEEGRFRQDLYYRLNVFSIEVAALRQRKDDIPRLAAHFLEQSARHLNLRLPRLTRAHIVELQSYDWPGNVRELQNVIERGLILAQRGALTFDLPADTRFDTLPVPQAGSLPNGVERILTETELRQRDRANILAALTKADWKVHGPNGAAELLGINPTTLISRLKKLGLRESRKDSQVRSSPSSSCP